MSTSSAIMAHQAQDLGLPREIMQDIFLRLDAPEDLVRASAACRSHRGVICDRGFLRRYRVLHPPPILGFLQSMGNGGFHPADTPHKSGPAAKSLAQAADFTFSFLPMEPNTFPWRICDARDGRVLLSRRSADDSATFLELVICDPLYRRYVEIPAIPEDLWDKRYSTKMESEPFLLPAREEEEESQFRVIYNWVSEYKIISLLYDSDTKKWSLATSFSFVLSGRLIHDPKKLVRHRHYVGSSFFYWVHHLVSSNNMLVLDLLEMKFSIITGLPFGKSVWRPNGLVVVDAGVNRLGIAVLDPARNLDIYSKTWQNKGSAPERWQHDKHHQLPEGYRRCCIIGAAEGYFLLGGRCNRETVQYSLLDLKTFQVERFCKSMDAVYHALPYARFLPSLLSPPSI